MSDVVDFEKSGCDLDGDILLKMDGTLVYVNHEAIFHKGYVAGQKQILEHLTRYLAPDIDKQNMIYQILNMEGG